MGDEILNFNDRITVRAKKELINHHNNYFFKSIQFISNEQKYLSLDAQIVFNMYIILDSFSKSKLMRGKKYVVSGYSLSMIWEDKEVKLRIEFSNNMYISLEKVEVNWITHILSKTLRQKDYFRLED